MATFITSVLRTFPIDPIMLQKKINEKFPLQFREALQNMSLKQAPYCLMEMFIAPDVSLNFVDMLTPFFAVDATFLKTTRYGKYTMYACTAQTTNFCPIILAIGFYSSETTDGYRSFFNELYKAYSSYFQKNNTAIISDGSQSIARAMEKSLPGVTHYGCTKHLSNRLKDVKLFPNVDRKRFIGLFHYLQSVVDKRKASLIHQEIISMVSDSSPTAQYIRDLDKFSYAHVNRPQFNQITSNSVEVTNNIMRSLRSDHPWSITQAVFSLVHKQINNEWQNHYNNKHYEVLMYDDKPLIPGLTYSLSFSIEHMDDYDVENFENNENEYVVTLREDSVLMFYFQNFSDFKPSDYPGLYATCYKPYGYKKTPTRKARLNQAFSKKHYHVDLANHCCS